jgi:protein-S-isoprenylcysteine O-methyltransferase Ste14
VFGDDRFHSTCALLVLAGRIVDEEKLLATELAGYDEYRRRVRYRPLPLVW